MTRFDWYPTITLFEALNWSSSFVLRSPYFVFKLGSPRGDDNSIVVEWLIYICGGILIRLRPNDGPMTIDAAVIVEFVVD